MKAFEENTKSHREPKEEILEQQTPNTSTDLPTVPFSDTSVIPAPFIFIKSDLRLVIDLQTCIKAQQSEAYAQKVKLTNLKQMAQTVATYRNMAMILLMISMQHSIRHQTRPVLPEDF